MSLQDRIQNLQRATENKDNTGPSVASRTAAVERANQAGTSLRPQLSALTKQFEKSTDNSNSTTSERLGAHIAKFDSSSESLSQRVKQLQSTSDNIPTTSSIAGRTAAFERSESNSTQSISSRFQSTNSETVTDSQTNQTRYLFEKHSQSSEKEDITKKVSQLNINKTNSKTDDETKNVTIKSEEPKDETVSTLKQMTDRWQQDTKPISNEPTTTGMVTNIWTARERGETETTTSGTKPKASDSWLKKENSSKSTTSEPVKKASSKSLHQPPKSTSQQLKDLKQENEQLISTLLDLTKAFKKLEESRHTLQKRIAQLENS